MTASQLAPAAPADHHVPVLGRMPVIDVPPLAQLDPVLTRTSAARRAWVVGRPLLLTVLFLAAAARDWWIVALALFLPLFISQVVAINDVVHRAIGLGPRASELVLAAIGMIVLESGHAIRVTHLAHHAEGGGADDPESYVDLLPRRRLLLEVPIFRFRLWAFGWRHGSRRERVWMVGEITWAGGVVLASALGLAPAPLLALALLAIVAGWGFPLVSALGPQADWGRDRTLHAYRVRGRVVPRLLGGLPYHLEHHLYPDVPTHRLADLARIAAPTLERTGIKEVRTW